MTVVERDLPRNPGSDIFVGREEQIQAFEDALRMIGSGKSDKAARLFEWHGVPGIGKSTLINEITNSCVDRSIPCVEIDINSASPTTDNYTNNPLLVVDQIASSLKHHGIDTRSYDEYRSITSDIPLPDKGVCREYASLTEKARTVTSNSPAWLQVIDLSLAKFDTVISHMPKNRLPRLVVCIDAGNSTPELLFDWIEELLVKRLVQNKHDMVIWTARNPRKWKRPEIRWDRRSEELHPFDEAEVRRYISHTIPGTNLLSERLSHDIYMLTGGHPHAVAVVSDELKKTSDMSQDTVREHTSDLLRAIYERVFEEAIVPQLSIDQRVALEVGSMIRLIDTTTLQNTLPTIRNGLEKWKRKEYDRLLFDLRKTYLLRWEKSGWILESSVRHLIRSYHFACNPEMFTKVNEAGLAVYQRWLSSMVDNRDIFIFEELYHLASLRQLTGNDPHIVEVFSKRLAQYPEDTREHLESWNSTKKRLLRLLVNDGELAGILRQDERQQLIHLLKTKGHTSRKTYPVFS